MAFLCFVLFLLCHQCLTHWGQVTHICISNLTTIGSGNGLLPGRCQTIIWTNIGILLVRTWGTNFRKIFSEIHTFSFKKKMHLKMSPVKWLTFWLGLNVLMDSFHHAMHLLILLGMHQWSVPEGYEWNWLIPNYTHTQLNNSDINYR